jgi:hypothetical protein
VIEWVDFSPIFESSAAVVVVAVGHVGNALALSIMSTAMRRLALLMAQQWRWVVKLPIHYQADRWEAR